MLLQIADLIASVNTAQTHGAEPGTPMRESEAVLYVTAEESVDQVGQLLNPCECTGPCLPFDIPQKLELEDNVMQVQN